MKLKSISSYKGSVLTTAFTTIVFLLPLVTNAQIIYQLRTKIFPTSIEALIVSILNILIIIATPIIVLFIIYSGFLYVTARGNAEQTKQATRSLTYSIIGAVLILGAVAISRILSNIVESFTA